MVIMIIGNNLARAFALVGALSIIRFRTVVKDTKDTAYIFWALAAGMAYLIGQDPVDTQKTFVLGNNFETMEECKQELLLKTLDNNTYSILYDFVVVNNFEYDWLMAGCKNEDTGEKFIIEPTYPEGKPDELKGIILDKNFNIKHIFEL